MKKIISLLVWTFRAFSFLIVVALQLINPFHQFIRMAVTQNPITGRMKGQAGGMVFSKWFGLNTMRAYNPNPQKSETTKQLAQRQKFTIIQEVLSPALVFVRKGFELFTQGKTAFNVAMSKNLKSAITGAYPNFAVDYQKLVLSEGTLKDLGEVSDTAVSGHKVHCEWTRDGSDGDCDESDQVNICIMNTDTKEAVVAMGKGPRADGETTITVPASWIGDSCVVIKAGSELSGTVKGPSQPTPPIQIIA